ncbi:MAG: prepilin-type N-terminal cleavage/methylation domain-containing protein [Pseudohongiellaceae bacterium]
MTPISAVNTGSRQPGFTLLELLLVVSIIIIAVGIVIPNLNTLDTSVFNAQIRKAAAALTYARRIAIVEAQPKAVVLYAFDPERADYQQLRAQMQTENPAAHWESDLLDLKFQTDANQLAAAVERIEITFYPQGGSTGGLLNFGLNERSATIKVDPITGRITTAYNGETLAEEK